MPPPVIVVGMHRSGTGILVRALERAGLFVGADTQADQESGTFVELNRRLLLGAGATWDDPERFQAWLERVGTTRAAAGVRLCLEGRRTARYLGMSRYQFGAKLHHVKHPWGWKDPRNTFTLPVWLELFPEARVIHVMRHGLDVGFSLMERERRGVARWLRTPIGAIVARARPLSVLRRGRAAGFVDIRRRPTMETYIQLWSHYVRQARTHVQQLQSRAMEVHYEEFVTAPEETLKCLAQFCGLSPSNARVRAATRDVHGVSAFAYRYREDSALVERAYVHALRAAGYRTIMQAHDSECHDARG